MNWKSSEFFLIWLTGSPVSRGHQHFLHLHHQCQQSNFLSLLPIFPSFETSHPKVTSLSLSLWTPLLYGYISVPPFLPSSPSSSHPKIPASPTSLSNPLNHSHIVVFLFSSPAFSLVWSSSLPCRLSITAA